jgi:eukaryotic-like serine/threonine-protein kinase
MAHTNAELHVNEFAKIDQDARARLGSRVHEKWVLEAIVGIGGMGSVYRARHRNGSIQAIKIMHREYIADEKLVARFFREAEYANQIGHPAVLRVFDDGLLPDGCPYMVTELLEGRTLEEEREASGGVLPLANVVHVGVVVADVLARAQEVGLIHRDLKPVNLFRTRSGEIRVLDFGLGKSLLDQERNSGKHKLTEAFVVMGTVGFMSPEQARGKIDQIGHATDIYALGATLLMLATGLETHPAETSVELLGLTATQPVPETLTRVAIHPSLARVIDKALKFRIHDRYASAATMRSDLERIAAEIGAPLPAREQLHSAGNLDVSGNMSAAPELGAKVHTIKTTLDEPRTMPMSKWHRWTIRTKSAVAVGSSVVAAVLIFVTLFAIGLIGNRSVDPSKGSTVASADTADRAINRVVTAETKPVSSETQPAKDVPPPIDLGNLPPAATGASEHAVRPNATSKPPPKAPGLASALPTAKPSVDSLLDKRR